MRNHQLEDGLCQLTHALGRLERQWSEAELLWNDVRSQQFKEAHLPEFKARMQHILTAIHNFMATIDEATRDLSDEASTDE